MELLKLLNLGEIIAQMVNFLILLFVLRILFWKRILKLLDARKEKIASELRNIDQAKEEVMQLRADYEVKLAAIEQAAQKRIQGAVAEGRIISEEARKKAQATAQEIIDNARLSVQYELNKAKVELKDEIVDLTIRAAEMLIREKLTGEEDKRLVKDFIDGVDKV